jgi:Antitoxin Phd_YefM, type II toxin-antitoxin system
MLLGLCARRFPHHGSIEVEEAQDYYCNQKLWSPGDSMDISAAQFKAECLKLMDQVEKTREPIVITKHGRPLARKG